MNSFRKSVLLSLCLAYQLRSGFGFKHQQADDAGKFMHRTARGNEYEMWMSDLFGFVDLSKISQNISVFFFFDPKVMFKLPSIHKQSRQPMLWSISKTQYSICIHSIPPPGRSHTKPLCQKIPPEPLFVLWCRLTAFLAGPIERCFERSSIIHTFAINRSPEGWKPRFLCQMTDFESLLSLQEIFGLPAAPK